MLIRRTILKAKNSSDIHQRVTADTHPHDSSEYDKVRQNSTLASHMESHSEFTPYKCFTCGKYFKHKRSLTAHLRLHTGESPYVCSVCDRSFAYSSTLKNHMTTHSEETPYMCKTCGKSFKQKGNLNVHLRLHTGESPYVCSVCDKSFNNKSNLARHMKTHSKQTLQDSEAKYTEVNLTDCDSSLSTTANDRAEGLPSQDPLPIETKLHTSEVPFSIRVKIEEDF